MFIRKKSIL